MAKPKKKIPNILPKKPQPSITQQNVQMPVIPQGMGIEDSFQAMQQKNEMAEVLKELFDKDKIKLTTDLTKDEIKLVTRILVVQKLKDLPQWKVGTEMFMELMLSHRRQSRKEILSAIEGYYRRMHGLMDRIRDKFSRN